MTDNDKEHVHIAACHLGDMYNYASVFHVLSGDRAMHTPKYQPLLRGEQAHVHTEHRNEFDNDVCCYASEPIAGTDTGGVVLGMTMNGRHYRVTVEEAKEQ